MTATEDAALIRQAVRVLRSPRPSLTVLAAVDAPLMSLEAICQYFEAAARHSEGWPPCCRAGAGRCTYAGPALARSRRVLAAAQNKGTGSAAAATPSADPPGRRTAAARPPGDAPA